MFHSTDHDSNIASRNDFGFHILAISGGGFRGLFAALILAHMEEELGAPLARKFDLIAGTSIGGILALAIAAEIPLSRLVALFTDHGHDIFAPTVFGMRRPRWLVDRLNWGVWSSKYTSAPLRQLLSAPDLFGDRTLGDLPHRVLVPAVNVTKGGPCMFKTPHHPNWKMDWKHRLVDVAPLLKTTHCESARRRMLDVSLYLSYKSTAWGAIGHVQSSGKDDESISSMAWLGKAAFLLIPAPREVAGCDDRTGHSTSQRILLYGSPCIVFRHC
ncbi:hypothetical protein AU476_20370 [Cupriavidus sp. UYMSc13B]|nr:hypothetical protein AU476_20370 [Cupriavidus sp. UYMSc13B]